MIAHKWAQGDKVEAGEPGSDDYDTGVVHGTIEDGQYAGWVLVGWDRAAANMPADPSELRAR